MTAAFFEATRAAEEARVDETARCVRLQSAWRRVMCVAFFNEQRRTIRLMQRHLRGWLGRQKARRARRERDIGRQRAVFDAIATTIQRRFRAYHSRKYRHSFYARQVRAPLDLPTRRRRRPLGLRRAIVPSAPRPHPRLPPQAYVSAVRHKGEAMVRALGEQYEAQVTQQQLENEAAARKRLEYLASKLHHLRSTDSCYGIYNSPYHVGFHPTAFGVPVEDHLKSAIKCARAAPLDAHAPPSSAPPPIPRPRRVRRRPSRRAGAAHPAPRAARPVLQRELKMKAKTLRPLQSLPPIPPHAVPAVTPASLEATERQERWLNKTTRIAPHDFISSVGTRKLMHEGSVHKGWTQATNFERVVTKEKWVSKARAAPRPCPPSPRSLSPPPRSAPRSLSPYARRRSPSTTRYLRTGSSRRRAPPANYGVNGRAPSRARWAVCAGAQARR